MSKSTGWPRSTEPRAVKAVAELKFKATANLDWHHNNLIRAAREAYESTVETDRSLRDVVTIKLVNRPKLLELEEVQNLLREVPMLAYDLLMLTYRTQSHLWALQGNSVRLA